MSVRGCWSPTSYWPLCSSTYSPRGVEPYDSPKTVFVQRHEPQGGSSILSSTDFFQSEENRHAILERVDNFQLRDKYMFATTTRVGGHRRGNKDSWEGRGLGSLEKSDSVLIHTLLTY